MSNVDLPDGFYHIFTNEQLINFLLGWDCSKFTFYQIWHQHLEHRNENNCDSGAILWLQYIICGFWS